ncbi:hypothetical protein H9634_01030 [Brevibacterium sp. Re57]|uniref:Uncharacterized protein n=1 Tax=Brevibacterium gallinarum TaxID=2762220 RepID=A0ABR8WQK9_9MICO|nr:hypothetical protein [Brevibacterium gallinarum]
MMSECSYPCTISDCDGTASLTLDPAHYEGDQIVGDRLIYRCQGCAHIWDEHGRPMGLTEEQDDE